MVITREQAQEALLADHRSLFYMAGNPDVVEVFECEGSFSFLQEQHHFTFRIHADSSVRVDLKPLNVDTNDESVGFPIEEEQNSTGDNTTEQEDEEQETEENAKLLAYDGRAMVELQSEEQREAQLVCYVVHFKIVLWGRGAQGMWSQIVKCIAHLSPEFGMSGRFVEIRENVEEAQEFVLRPVKHRVEPLENALHPLTPGYYELQGVTIAENAFVYECAVSLKLEANGMVSGTSRELPFSQECPLAANKSRFHLRISSDGSLHGEIRQKLQKTITAATNGKKRKRRVIADHPDGFVVAHVVGNAQVVPTEEAFVSTTTVGCDQTSAAEYCCAFEVTKRLNHVDRHTLTCHLHVPVAADARAVGTWRFFNLQNQDRHLLDVSSSASTASTSDASSMGDTTEELMESTKQKVFQLQPVQWCERQQEAEAVEAEAALMQSREPSSLYPLRPGRYEFRGFTTYDTASIAPVAARPQGRRRGRPRPRPRPAMTTVKDECLVTLRLLPDGTLRGTSREVVQPQVCPLRGRWQANRVAYVLEYRVREAVGHFRYSGAVVIEEGDDNVRTSKSKNTKAKTKTSANGKRREMLSGKWNNVDEGHAEGYEGGRGQFELELVRVDFSQITIMTEKIENKKMNGAGVNKDDTMTSQCDSDQLQQASQQASGRDVDNAIVLNDDDADVIRKFTTGEYELSGRATDTDGYEYAFDVKLQLRPGGKLFGESRERIFQQKGPIFGLWQPSGIVYRQQYVVKHEVGVYTYSGSISQGGAIVNVVAGIVLVVSDYVSHCSVYNYMLRCNMLKTGVVFTFLAAAASLAMFLLSCCEGFASKSGNTGDSSSDGGGHGHRGADLNYCPGVTPTGAAETLKDVSTRV
ncbi:hypothetical protein BBJ29_002206 [Phytophthora kernoviae]|uniref:Uncharacterized protein n=1 Tax=Phytophthora kernoviae TaxID=325452 RepID=A0A3F2RV62_9STRA|nr:hypothetical protein BBJ29_002206 [Phytophthora kernoviae]RLN64856.1 hypothetical protein BBP00_00003178 [Phytophthora kernoviae]